MAAFLDHMGFRVGNLDWYVEFFGSVFGMDVERMRTNPDGTREVWLSGGLQLCEAPEYDGADGRAHHLCLLVEDVEAVRALALEKGCSELPKHHWIKLPDGLQIEMFAAAPGALDTLTHLQRKKDK